MPAIRAKGAAGPKGRGSGPWFPPIRGHGWSGPCRTSVPPPATRLPGLAPPHPVNPVHPVQKQFAVLRGLAALREDAVQLSGRSRRSGCMVSHCVPVDCRF